MTALDPKLAIVIKVLQVLTQAEQDAIVKALAKPPFIAYAADVAKVWDGLNEAEKKACQSAASSVLYDQSGNWNYDMSTIPDDEYVMLSYWDGGSIRLVAVTRKPQAYLGAYAWKLAPEPAKVK